MTIKWTEQDVINEMEKALAPSQNGTGRANLLKQLGAKAQELKQTTQRKIFPRR